MGKKIMVLVLAVVMIFGVFGLSGCENADEEFEVDGWTLIQFGRDSSKKGQVNILSADESLVVDGALHVPSKIGSYDIHGFGTYGAMFGPETVFTVPSNVEMIVLAAELHIGNLFWEGIYGSESSVKFVEFSCETFERVWSFWGTKKFTIIIPNGSTQGFIARIDELYPSQGLELEMIFIEKLNIVTGTADWGIT